MWLLLDGRDMNELDLRSYRTFISGRHGSLL